MITITTSDGITHGPIPLIDELPNIVGYSNSLATRAALAEAYADGQWEDYTAPPVEAPEPNPALFRAALAQTESWLGWASTLPSVGYTNLTIAAAQNNWAEAQLIYDRLVDNSLPPTGAAADWQALADANGIPIIF